MINNSWSSCLIMVDWYQLITHIWIIYVICVYIYIYTYTLSVDEVLVDIFIIVCLISIDLLILVDLHIYIYIYIYLYYWSIYSSWSVSIYNISISVDDKSLLIQGLTPWVRPPPRGLCCAPAVLPRKTIGTP